jgi:hypothetical protein
LELNKKTEGILRNEETQMRQTFPHRHTLPSIASDFDDFGSFAF